MIIIVTQKSACVYKKRKKYKEAEYFVNGRDKKN